MACQANFGSRVDTHTETCDLNGFEKPTRRRVEPSMATEIKICGLKTDETVAAAVEAGADFVGFVFFPRSPRHVSTASAAGLAKIARRRAGIVALVVDPEDALLDEIVATLRPDLLQLHGHESPERVAAIRAHTGVPVMKALAIADAEDLSPVAAYRPHVDRFLFDAKPPRDLSCALPGGNGLSFDWRLVAGFDAGRPAMLSGGLTPDNVGNAMRLTGMSAVDVSSGVERAPGEKDIARITAFIAAARSAL